ncbi:hypothetical protein HAX54_049348 [Datura stramonium]|uniref:Uncharacterized protein n=1 Tax=Datura stramonium TaxID=4076 RepID=A0ABS8WKD6_DATST|nr:hypothetical protein [Datura stramonium]
MLTGNYGTELLLCFFFGGDETTKGLWGCAALFVPGVLRGCGFGGSVWSDFSPDTERGRRRRFCGGGGDGASLVLRWLVVAPISGRGEGEGFAALEVLRRRRGKQQGEGEYRVLRRLEVALMEEEERRRRLLWSSAKRRGAAAQCFSGEYERRRLRLVYGEGESEKNDN